MRGTTTNIEIATTRGDSLATSLGSDAARYYGWKDSKGGDPAEWAGLGADLAIRQFPQEAR
jgi:hypothetical protein